MKLWHRALLGLFACALAPVLHAANPCESGGSPIMRDGSGAGGTGVRQEGTDGTGQGGTGLTPYRISGGDGTGTGGTGHAVEVDGVITGFASICVNGLELHYVPSTPVMIQGKSGSPKDLRVGQVVRVRAQGQGEQLSIQRLDVRHLLVSPLQQIGGDGLRIQGRNITLSPQAVLPNGLVPGVKVAVSGFATEGGHAVATRLDVVPDDTPDSLSGEAQRNTKGEWTVAGVALKGRLPQLEQGELVHAEGRYENGWMQVTRLEREERALSVDRIVMQGLVRRANKSGVSINGQHFVLDAQTRIKQAPPRAGEWAIVDAVRAGGQFHAREIDAHSFPGKGMDRPRKEEGGHSKQSRQDRTAQQQAERDAATGNEPSSREEVKHPENSDSEVPPSDKFAASEKIERQEKPERPEKVDRPEKVERPETVERPERIERVEKVERPETIERPERIERIEKVERPERIERVERPERDD